MSGSLTEDYDGSISTTFGEAPSHGSAIYPQICMVNPVYAAQILQGFPLLWHPWLSWGGKEA